MLGIIKEKFRKEVKKDKQVGISDANFVVDSGESLRDDVAKRYSGDSNENLVNSSGGELTEINGENATENLNENSQARLSTILENEAQPNITKKRRLQDYNKKTISKNSEPSNHSILFKFFRQWSEERLVKKRRKILIPKDKKLKKPKKIGNVLLMDSKKYHKDSILAKFINIIIDTFYEFAAITKVNGMYYLRRFVTHGFQRILWSCIMLTLLSFAAALIYLLYRRFLDSPTRVTIASPMLIHEIPFPGITICHPQNVMEYKSKEFIEKAKLPLGATPEYTIEILPLLAGFTERQWIVPRIEDLEMIDAILDANNLTVKAAIDKLGTVCQDFLLVCVFAGKKFPCFQQHPYLKFEESYSYLGACCSFNYHPDTLATAEFFKASSFGVDGGLSVIGTGRPQASDGFSGAIYSEGFVVIVHHPNDFAVESAPTTYIDLKKESFIDIQPIHSSCSDQVLVLPFAQRQCIIPSDKGRLNYRQPECILGCIRDEIHRRCRCHPFHLPKMSNQSHELRDCKAADILCFVDNYFQFKTTKCDHCYPSCTDVVYKTSSFKMNIDQLEHAVDDLYVQTNLTENEFIVRIFYGGQRVAANKKIVVMSWISLLSNLGGSFSLCLGMSVLSLCEIIFFILIRMCKHYKRIFQVGPVMPKYRKDEKRF